jgi:protein CMS1
MLVRGISAFRALLPMVWLTLTRAGALSSDKLDRIVVDLSHIDQKKRGIADMRETQEPLMRLLTRKELKDRYGLENGGLELLFF